MGLLAGDLFIQWQNNNENKGKGKEGEDEEEEEKKGEEKEGEEFDNVDRAILVGMAILLGFVTSSWSFISGRNKLS